MKKGTDLTLSQQREVLAKYVHRYTGTHKPSWAKDCPACAVQFKDDADWLGNTLFAVTKSGKLDGRVKFCQSSPTWPNNPELRR